jgi:FtsP/CotA-like multicopper oxidase with cupredoxin domain
MRASRASFWYDSLIRSRSRSSSSSRSLFELPPGAVGPQKYVFHCHVLEDEDNDTMRPYEVL